MRSSLRSPLRWPWTCGRWAWSLWATLESDCSSRSWHRASDRSVASRRPWAGSPPSRSSRLSGARRSGPGRRNNRSFGRSRRFFSRPVSAGETRRSSPAAIWRPLTCRGTTCRRGWPSRCHRWFSSASCCRGQRSGGVRRPASSWRPSGRSCSSPRPSPLSSTCRCTTASATCTSLSRRWPSSRRRAGMSPWRRFERGREWPPQRRWSSGSPSRSSFRYATTRIRTCISRP